MRSEPQPPVTEALRPPAKSVAKRANLWYILDEGLLSGLFRGKVKCGTAPPDRGGLEVFTGRAERSLERVMPHGNNDFYLLTRPGGTKGVESVLSHAVIPSRPARRDERKR